MLLENLAHLFPLLVESFFSEYLVSFGLSAGSYNPPPHPDVPFTAYQQ